MSSLQMIFEKGVCGQQFVWHVLDSLTGLVRGDPLKLSLHILASLYGLAPMSSMKQFSHLERGRSSV
jgi:hypothetical protein